MKLSKEHAAIIGAYTGVLCGPFEELHSYIENLLERPVFIHELGDREMSLEIKRLSKAAFLDICRDGVAS